MKIKINKKPVGIVDLYNIIAGQLGYDPEKCNYDCRKIEVSESIYDIISEEYEDKEAFAMHWLIYGPKVNKDLIGMEVSIQDGFVEEE